MLYCNICQYCTVLTIANNIDVRQCKITIRLLMSLFCSFPASVFIVLCLWCCYEKSVLLTRVSELVWTIGLNRDRNSPFVLSRIFWTRNLSLFAGENRPNKGRASPKTGVTRWAGRKNYATNQVNPPPRIDNAMAVNLRQTSKPWQLYNTRDHYRLY